MFDVMSHDRSAAFACSFGVEIVEPVQWRFVLGKIPVQPKAQCASKGLSVSRVDSAAQFKARKKSSRYPIVRICDSDRSSERTLHQYRCLLLGQLKVNTSAFDME